MKLFLITLLSTSTALAASSASMASGSNSPHANPDREPYLGHYGIEESCQYKICGSAFNSEFSGRMGGTPTQGSCSGDCDSAADRLVDSKFKKETLWDKCSDMCVEKYPTYEYRSVQTKSQVLSFSFIFVNNRGKDKIQIRIFETFPILFLLLPSGGNKYFSFFRLWYYWQFIECITINQRRIKISVGWLQANSANEREMRRISKRGGKGDILSVSDVYKWMHGKWHRCH